MARVISRASRFHELGVGKPFASAVKEADDGPFLVGREPRKVSATVKNRRHMKNQRCLQE